MRPASGLVLGVNDLDAQGSGFENVALDHLGHIVEPRLAQQRRGIAGDDEGGRRPQMPYRGEVQMVEVDVREEREVDVGVVVRRERPAATEMGDPAGQERIGDDPVSVDVEEHRRVSDPGDGGRAVVHRLLNSRSVAAARSVLRPAGSTPRRVRHGARRGAIP